MVALCEQIDEISLTDLVSTMELIELQLFFHDEATIALAGVSIKNPAAVKAIPGAIPRAGEVVKFSGLNYKTGEIATFRVVSISHLFGDRSVQKIQASLELVVLHQP